jgi:hypothetical protein
LFDEAKINLHFIMKSAIGSTPSNNSKSALIKSIIEYGPLSLNQGLPLLDRD